MTKWWLTPVDGGHGLYIRLNVAKSRFAWAQYTYADSITDAKNRVDSSITPKIRP